MYIANKERYETMKYTVAERAACYFLLFRLVYGTTSAVTTVTTIWLICLQQLSTCITHFDLANNYGPYPAVPKKISVRFWNTNFLPYRDELIHLNQSSYGMWDGPYGDHGSRKYLIASLDQSLKRMGLEYVDIFYHHRPDPDTPMEETASALDHIVRSGKALYVGISNYNAEQTKQMAEIMKSLGTPLVIHQPRYNMFERWIENGLQEYCKTRV